MATDGRAIERKLETEDLRPEDALGELARVAREAPTSARRLEACCVLGALSGRAHGASREVAERAAFVLLDVAREADAPAERAGLLHAMGRGFRNLWLMPYVHRRLSEGDEAVVAAAISAAGGLAFPALEEAIASGFLGADVSPALRFAAISALGRMGAESAAARLVPFVVEGGCAAIAALGALTEIRSRVGEGAARDVLSRDPPREVLVAAVRYLAEIGSESVLPTLRRLARDEDADLRIAASLASFAFKAERTADATERILAALTERDRAVRASLARRLRTLPVASVLEQAEVLLSEDAEGVVQIIAEVRTPEVTRTLLRLAADGRIDQAVRARAAGAIEADEPWERDAVVELARTSRDTDVRVAAVRTLGAFASPAYLLDHLATLADEQAPALRGALLWALGLAARPEGLVGQERARCEAIVRRALADTDPIVRRRAAYVAGNLDAGSLVPDLVKLARDEADSASHRVAAFVALAEIASPARFTDLVFLYNREDDPEALAAASRAIERSLAAVPLVESPPSATPLLQAAPASAPASLARVHDRLRKLIASADPRARAAAARIAGLTPGAVPTELLASLLDDPAPRVREQAVTALGRLAAPDQEAALVRALADADVAVQERAAEALLAQGTALAVGKVLDFVTKTQDRALALRLVARVTRPDDDPTAFLSALGAALARIAHEHPAYEPLLELKIAALEASQPAPASAPSVEAVIAAAFPAWPRLARVRGFAPLAKSLRTAEMLHASTAATADADLSAAIVLWMKCLEGYMHAWLAPRLGALQQQPGSLWEVTDRVLGAAWPAYQRYLGERWADPVKVGAISVEVPLQSVVNALRDFQEHRLKSLDAPMSVTEWSRIMLFFAVDHPSGPKNLLRVAARDADRAVRLAHRLQVLAQVRNVVTHRSVAGPSTVSEFRRAYYPAFEELTAMA
jgi:HEAT repeat protein